ncbi:MAG: hypothetical protein KC457_29425, partial [Myxococcales bacterium]|nr:hypothetical protein [Myxococcales bacterium]
MRSGEQSTVESLGGDLGDQDDQIHQALDLLDELRLGRLWVATRTGESALGDELDAAIEACDEDPQEIREAAALARPALRRALLGTGR